MYEVLKYIHERIREELSLTDIATIFGYSKWHFCSKFHKYTGRSFSKYIRHFRLHLASLEILEGKKIADIATEYGYDSPSGFNKAFVSDFGCYPSEYKTQSKEALGYNTAFRVFYVVLIIAKNFHKVNRLFCHLRDLQIFHWQFAIFHYFIKG